jgi:hypothetical protein
MTHIASGAFTKRHGAFYALVAHYSGIAEGLT